MDTTEQLTHSRAVCISRVSIEENKHKNADCKNCELFSVY